MEYPTPEQARYGGITPEKYAELIADIRNDPLASSLEVGIAPLPALNIGRVTYQEIDFKWIYDGVDELTVTIVKIHNWKAKIAGNMAIFGILNDKLISKI